MRGGEAVGDLRREIEQPLQRDRSAVEFVAQRPAVDELRDDERSTAFDGGIEHRDDVGMVERAGGARFGNKRLDALWIALEPRVQDLQRDVALEPRIPGPVNLPRRRPVREDRESSYGLSDIRRVDPPEFMAAIWRRFYTELC